jgi:3D (Asp-Asp-Asp) domain-containing protein
MRLLISRSLWHKLLVASMAVVGFVLVYDVSTFDSQDVTHGEMGAPTAPAPRTRLQFSATAYCKGTTTAAGVRVRGGIAAADPALLPLGSVVDITTEDEAYKGIYTILDTGPAVRGRLLDLYMWSCYEALDFGRQQIEVTVLRLGWDPSASEPSVIDRAFERREAERRSTPPTSPRPVSAALPEAKAPQPDADSDAADEDTASAQPEEAPEPTPD